MSHVFKKVGLLLGTADGMDEGSLLGSTEGAIYGIFDGGLLG